MKKDKKGSKKHHSTLLRSVTVVFLLSTLITIAACSVISYQAIMYETKSNSTDVAYSVSILLNDIYNSDQEEEKQPLLRAAVFKKDDKINQITEMLRMVCIGFDFQYMYVFDIDEESESYLYYYVVAADDKVNEKVSKERSYGTVVRMDSIPQQVLEAKRGSVNTDVRVVDNQYGKVYSWVYPLFDSEGNVQYLIGADISAGEIEGTIFTRVLNMSLPIAILLLVTLISLMLIIRFNIIKPVAMISQKMNNFIRDGSIQGEAVNIRSDNEIGEIADSFNKMQRDISRYISEINDLTTERVQNQTQMEIANRIQNGIVPPETALSGKEYNVCAIEKPCREVGGDFYDCFLINGDQLCTVVGDVSGKGITAALFMVMTKTSVREKLMRNLSPAQALNMVNDEICAANPEGLFATVFVSVLHLKTGQLDFANAGHTRPVLLGSKMRFLNPDAGIAIGLFEDADIKDECLLLSPGEGMMLYTDGVTEAVNPSDSFFGEGRLLNVLKDQNNAKSAVSSLQNEVETFYDGREAFDDLTILSFFFEAPSELRSLSPDIKEFDTIKSEVGILAGKSKRYMKIMLACEEIFTNIVNYSKAEKIQFATAISDRNFSILLADDGESFDPTAGNINEKDFDDLDTGGMGIALAKGIAEKMLYKRENDQNNLLMVFEL